MKTTKLMSTLILGAALMLSACGSSSSDDDQSLGSRNGSRGTPETYNPFNDSSYFYTAATGSVTPASGFSSAFESIIKNLLSASMDVSSSNVGSIGTGSVSFRGYVELQSSTRLNSSTSSMLIRVQDSKSSSSAPIEIYMSGDRANVQVSGSRYVITFQDSYGSVTFDGTVSGSTYSGNLNYNNETNDHHATGTLKFSIEACGFFLCHR